MTEEEYLEHERTAEYKSEYVEGEVFAMPGGTLRHSHLQMVVGAEFLLQLRGRCSVYSSDAKVRSPRTNSYLYPDVSIVCGAPAVFGPHTDVLVNPVVIIEVLSPSTENYDRGKKFELYRYIESLADYLMFHWEEPWEEHFHRQPDGRWLFSEYRHESRRILDRGDQGRVPVS
jgi:Uma2 family endonuclease